MIKQLRRTFVLINMSIVTAVLLVMFAYVYRSTQLSLQQQSLSTMQSVLPDFLRQDGNVPLPEDLPERTDGDEPSERQEGADLPDRRDGDGLRRPERREVLLPTFTLWEEDGTLTASGSAAYDLTDVDFLTQLAQAVAEDGNDSGVLSGWGLRYLVRSTPAGDFTVFADISSEQATLRSLLNTCAAVGAVSLLVFLAISILLSRWAVGPVERAWQQQRQFVADASHELKTPLTVITTNAELLQSCQTEERERFIDNILSMSDQMRGLVEGLLELARVDNGTAKMTFAPVDYSQLMEDALMAFEPVFFEAGLTLESRIQEGIVLNGSRQHLKQVADILLDNARKYADTGAQVEVDLRREDRGHCLLTVANQGPAISPQELEKLFQRFYRADTARSMDHSYGLGLSIARSVVQEHRGKIWAESREGWNRFCVRLPVS